MSGSRLEARLAARAADEAAVRAVSAILEWLPGDGDLPEWSSFEDGAAAMARGEAEAARKLADADEATRALRAFDALDEGEDVVSIASGVGTALRLAFSSGKGAAPAGLAAMLLRQRSDAADKILGVGVALSRCFPGTPVETLRRTRALPSGELLLRWLASVELFLPFVDQAVRSSPTGWLESERAAALTRVRAAMTDAELVDAEALWPVLVEDLVARAEALGRTPLDIAKLGFARLPRLAGVVDAAGSVAAGAVDYLPVYHLLGERVVAEALLDGGGWRPAAVEAAALAAKNEDVEFEFVVPPELRTTGDEAPGEGPGSPAVPVSVSVPVAAAAPEPVAAAADPEPAARAEPEPEPAAAESVVAAEPEPPAAPAEPQPIVDLPDAAPGVAAVPVAPVAAVVAPVVTREVTPAPEPVVVRTPTPEPVVAPTPSRPRPATPPAPSRPEAVSRSTPQGNRARAAAPPREEPSGSGGMLGLGAGVVVLLGLLCGGGALAAGGAWWFFASKGSPPALVASPPATPTPTPAVPAPPPAAPPVPAAVPVAPPAPVYPAVPAAAPAPTPAAAPAPAPAPKAAPAPTKPATAVKKDGKPFEPKKKKKKKDRSDR